MEIHGLQKLTLLDYPGKMACTVFLAGCNLRCPFCHNSELLDRKAAPAVMDDEELLRFLKKRCGMLDGVCITGGEPLLQPELPDLLRKIKALGYQVKLDTNGTMYERLRQIVAEGLVDYVAMDIKNSPSRYAESCGLETMDLESVYNSIELLRSGNVDYEFRTTVVEQLHDSRSFQEIGEIISGAIRYFLQLFTDRDTVIYAGFNAPSAEKMREYAEISRKFIDFVEIRGME